MTCSYMDGHLCMKKLLIDCLSLTDYEKSSNLMIWPLFNNPSQFVWSIPFFRIHRFHVGHCFIKMPCTVNTCHSHTLVLFSYSLNHMLTTKCHHYHIKLVIRSMIRLNRFYLVIYCGGTKINWFSNWFYLHLKRIELMMVIVIQYFLLWFLDIK